MGVQLTSYTVATEPDGAYTVTNLITSEATVIPARTAEMITRSEAVLLAITQQGDDSLWDNDHVEETGTLGALTFYTTMLYTSADEG